MAPCLPENFWFIKSCTSVESISSYTIICTERSTTELWRIEFLDFLWDLGNRYISLCRVEMQYLPNVVKN